MNAIINGFNIGDALLLTLLFSRTYTAPLFRCNCNEQELVAPDARQAASGDGFTVKSKAPVGVIKGASSHAWVGLYQTKFSCLGPSVIAGLQHGLNKLPEPGFIAGWVIAINILMDGAFDNP